MNIGVSAYSFSRLLRSGDMTLLDVIAKAKQMGFEAIDFVAFTAPDGQSLTDYARQLRRAAEDVGIAVANYAVGADFLRGSNGDLNAEIERVKDAVRLAAELGASRMRHDASAGFPEGHVGARSFDDALPRLIEGCRAVTAFAQDLGVVTTIENHGLFCQDSDRIEKLICGVDHPNFGVLLDIGNFICVDEDPARAVGRLAPYARHVHAKDFHLKPGHGVHPGEGWNVSRGGNFWRGAIIGHGDIPLLPALRRVRQAGYDDSLVIEFEGLEDPLTGIRIGQDNLRRLLEQA